LCRDCARARRLRRRLLLGGVVLAVLAVVGAAGWLAAGTLKVADTKRIAKGQHSGRITTEQMLALDIAKDLCNEKKYQAWVTEHAGSDCDKVLARAQFFFDQCGPFPRLRWATHSCHKRREQYDQALADVNMLIRDWPYDKDFRWWRGELLAEQKQWDRALDDYLQSVMLAPTLKRIPFDLAVQAKRAGQRCRAVFPMLQHAHYYPSWQVDPDDERIRLEAARACLATLGTGTATGSLSAGGGSPPLRVAVNGKATGDFALDLETGFTMLSRAFANKLGLPRGKPFLGWYGQELQTGHFVSLREVTWDGAKAWRVEALILESPPFFTDGVLGRTFLLRFTGSYNEDHTQVTLKPRVFVEPGP
jgi:tetratricopeptide (TPR) repeat protein